MTAFETFPEILARQAALVPERPCLIERERRLTYAETQAAVERLAAGLAARGLAPGDRLVAMFPGGIDYLLLWLAAARCGLILVPVNETLRGRVLAHQLTLADAAAVVLGPEQLLQVERDLPAEARPPGLILHEAPEAAPDQGWAWTLPFAALPAAPGADAPPRLQPWDPAAIYFTSGTTGPSKGVLYAHGQALATARPMAEALAEGEVFYFCYPLFHVSVPHMIGATLLRAGSVALRRRFSIGAFWDDVRHFGATATMMLGAIAGFVEGQPPAAGDRDHPLRRVLMVPLVRDPPAFCTRFGVTLMTWFNMTETSTPLHSDGFRRLEGTSCGRPREGVEARIVDETDRPLPPGAVGELVLRWQRPWEMNLGYWRNPEKTVEAWRNLWFHTGDAFRADAAGNFYFVDRKSDSIRRRGENISSYEIEAEALDHPAVVECAAVAVPGAADDVEVKLVACLAPGESLTPAALLAFLEPRLAPHMLPRYLELHGQELPKTPTGKIRKAALRESGTTEAWDRKKETR